MRQLGRAVRPGVQHQPRLPFPSEAKEASWSEVKQTTSQRPESPASEGKRFSKTTTSYDESGISLSRPSRDGHSGHSSAGG